MIATLLLLLAPAETGPRPASDVAARRAVAQFGACVADTSPDKAARTLTHDFRTVAFRGAMQALGHDNKNCLDHGRLAMRQLAIAGAIAERLIARAPAPIAQRLAQAAARPPVAGFTPTDNAAMCTVRRDPDDVAHILASAPASEDEVKAVANARAVYRQCGRDLPDTNDEELRAMLATATFRSVVADAAGKSG